VKDFSGNFFKFLAFQQEHGHGVVPADVEHKLLSNWLKNQRNYMRDFENKSGESNHTHYPDYYDLMVKCSVTGYKH
jgi:hypothetical protein